MVLQIKTSAHAVCIDPKKTNCPKKPPTKADIQEDLKMTKNDLKITKELNDALLEEVKENEATMEALKNENSKNIETIKILEDKVALLQVNKSPLVGKSHASQTFCSDIRINCNLCIYVATCEEELNWHMGDTHHLSDESYFDKDLYCEVCSKWCITEDDLLTHVEEHQIDKTDSRHSDGLSCNFCEETFMKHGDLMKHKKRKHEDRVALCWKFSAGNCTFGDANCWFLHHESEVSCTTSGWNCILCENEFRCRSELLRHRKKEHGHLVPMCRNGENGKCIYGIQNCWFKHDDIEMDFSSGNSTKENNEVIEKVFGMLEQMTKRILEIEKYNLTNLSKEQ